MIGIINHQIEALTPSSNNSLSFTGLNNIVAYLLMLPEHHLSTNAVKNIMYIIPCLIKNNKGSITLEIYDIANICSFSNRFYFLVFKSEEIEFIRSTLFEIKNSLQLLTDVKSNLTSFPDYTNKLIQFFINLKNINFTLTANCIEKFIFFCEKYSSNFNSNLISSVSKLRDHLEKNTGKINYKSLIHRLNKLIEDYISNFKYTSTTTISSSGQSKKWGDAMRSLVLTSSTQSIYDKKKRPRGEYENPQPTLGKKSRA